MISIQNLHRRRRALSTAVGGTPHVLLTAGQLRYRDAGGANPKEIGYLSSAQFLPRGAGHRVIVFSVGYAAGTILVRDLDDGREEVLGPGGSPFYSPSGHVLYRSLPGSPEVWARPFSLRTLKATGEAFQVLKGGADISMADDGTLVYVDAPSTALTWMNRKGVKIGSVGEPLEGSFLRSPRMAAGRQWRRWRMTTSMFGSTTWNAARGRASRLIPQPTLCRSGLRIQRGPRSVPTNPAILMCLWCLLTGVSARKQSSPVWQMSVCPIGPRTDAIFCTRNTVDNGFDIWYAEQSGSGGWNRMPFLQTASHEHAAKLSPDRRYVAYVSDETGRDEIYVRPFPAGTKKWPISTNGGRQVRWRRDGRELFYTDGAELFGVSVQSGPDVRPGVPVPLFSNPVFQDLWFEANYYVSPDGKRFLIPERLGGERRIHVFQNWFALNRHKSHWPARACKFDERKSCRLGLGASAPFSRTGSVCEFFHHTYTDSMTIRDDATARDRLLSLSVARRAKGSSAVLMEPA